MKGLWFRVKGLWFRVKGLRIRISSPVFEVKGLGSKDNSMGRMAQETGLQLSGSELRV